MKLVQLNIWGGRLEKQVANFLEEQQPDIACLQEAISIQGNGAIFVGFETLQQSWHKPIYSFHTPMFSFKFMNRIASFGNGIISTRPFIKKEALYTNLEPREDFDFEMHDYNVRNLQHVQFDIHGKKLHILNHHGHHIPAHKNGNESTMRQMKQIRNYINKLDGSIILTGDFNLSPQSKSLELINEKLDNLSVKYQLDTTRNELTYKKEVCDYIFVNDQVKVKDFVASDALVSDHKALILEFDI
jgi:endonuclease/exonuclease/phosphatase family metal-dependent hydrolase